MQDRAALAGYHAQHAASLRACSASSTTARPPRIAGGGRTEAIAAAMLGLDIRRLGRDPMREFLRIAGINIFDVLEETFESPLLKGALALDAVLGTNLGPRSQQLGADAAASPERAGHGRGGRRVAAARAAWAR